MLFNSAIFVFVYLPIVLAGFFLLGRANALAAACWLAVASLVFYGWTDWAYLLPLILISIAFNFLIGRSLAITRSRLLLTIGIAGDLGLLAWFKYSGFLAESLVALGVPTAVPHIILPIGISFFTFTQIAFLVDAFRGEAREYRLIHYVLFVTYFPHLIAGPILHHSEIMPQFAKAETYRFEPQRMLTGLSVFAVGLFKKVILADGIAPYADAQFAIAGKGTLLSVTDAWVGVSSYTLQLYFDFSGYSDMAIGLALMMGVKFPINFNSPYKSTSIIEFWRRWHITLSRFLRDYLYVPLGGNRQGKARRYINLLITMILGGLWHGASWNFVLWGAIHGVALACNNFWRDRGLRLPSWAGQALTLALVVAAWVPFRAQTIPDTLSVWGSMLGLHQLGSASTSDWVAMCWVAALSAVALLAPNTQELLLGARTEQRVLLRRPSSVVGVMICGIIFGASLARMFETPTTFLYFRF